MNEYTKENLKTLQSNTEKMSNAAYVKRLDAYIDQVGPINSDRTLTHISYICGVLFNINAIESVEWLQQKVEALNAYRSLLNHKPYGFDFLVEKHQRSLFLACLEVGLGKAQLQAIAWVLDLDQLKKHGLTELRAAA